MLKFAILVIGLMIFIDHFGVTLLTVGVTLIAAVLFTMNKANDCDLHRAGVIGTFIWVIGSVTGYLALAAWHTRIPHQLGALTWPVIIVFLTIPIQFLINNMIERS